MRAQRAVRLPDDHPQTQERYRLSVTGMAHPRQSTLEHDAGRLWRAAPSVTVLMTVKDDVRFVRAAIESVLSQTAPDLDLVVVDGGSTDGTLDVLKSFVSDSRVRVLQELRPGQLWGLQRGLDEVRTEYFIQLDSDDMLLPHAAAVLLDFMRNQPPSTGLC